MINYSVDSLLFLFIAISFSELLPLSQIHNCMVSQPAISFSSHLLNSSVTMARRALPDHYLFSHLLLLLLLVLHVRTLSQTINSNITLGSSLSTLAEKIKWVSPSGDFAFGFHRPGDNTTSTVFLLAISFNKILTEQTIVWFAKQNEDNPVQVQRGSKLEFTKSGSLVLTDENGQERWKPESGKVSYGAMLDDGNFVLASSDSIYRWQSFENPTDTILPTQQLQRNGKLSSCQSDTDYSTGKFQLRRQSGSSLVLNTISLPSRTSFAYEHYWSTEDTNNTNARVVFDPSSGVIVMKADGSFVNVTSGFLGSPSDYYQRARLDPDGVFRHYVYEKKNQTGSWTVASFIPENICIATFQVSGGSGPCGFNSYCQFPGDNNMSICSCPSGYSFSDPINPRHGCSPDFDSWSCKADSDNGSQTEATFDLRELPNVDWPAYDYERMDSMGEDGCRSACLSDCFCAVAIYRDSSCWKKRYPLSNGRLHSNWVGKALIKVPKTITSHSQIPISPDQGGRKKDRSTLITVGSVLLGSSIFVNLVLLSAICILTFFSSHKKLHPAGTSVAGMNVRSFTYRELEKATDGFKEELGRGAFGSVYKGALELDANMTLVAVKKLDKVFHKGEKEFKSEVSSISRTHHKNLVQLHGFCDEGLHRLLVYEYMSNGSLASFLFGSSKHNLNQRLQIALGIARGLLYLHEECSTQIIHCDIKPQNILLDDNFTARISDFGLAKLLSTDQSKTSTSIRGTKGYVAPEWFRNTAVTSRVDVYSFGVLLLEITCCRKNVDMEQDGDEKVILTDWANDCYRVGRLDMLVVDDEEVMGDGPRLKTLVAVALWCIQEDPSLRPSMKKVIQMLEGAVEVPVPPNLSFTSSMN